MAEIPVIRLKNITVAGNGVSLSSDVIRLCAEKGICLSFVDGIGKTYSVAQPPVGAQVDLVLTQIKHRDSDKGNHLARMFVWGKMKNQLALLKSYMKYRGHRDSKFGKEFKNRQPEMKRLLEKIKSLPVETEFRQSLMGLEGRFAADYWKIIKYLLSAEADFHGRVRRGANDLVNSMLNYGYGILYNQTLQAIIKAGLNSAAGFLHSCQGRRSSLVFDLVEEFRATVVDRAVFSILNRHQPCELGENNLLTQGARKKVVTTVLKRLGNEVPCRGKHCTLQQAILNQANAVKYHLQDQTTYRPFLSRW